MSIPHGSVVLAPPPPLLEPGDYEGLIVKVEVGPAPWPARKLRSWETERRRDWHAYYHVQLTRGLTPGCHNSLRTWVEHADRPAVVRYPCRYSTRLRDSKPLPLRESSHLHDLLTLTRPGTSLVGEDIPFEAPVGWLLRVRVVTSTRDRDGDPRPAQLRRSRVAKVLGVVQPPPNRSSQHSAVSKQQAAASEQQLSPPRSMESQALREMNGNGTSAVVAAASDGGRRQAGGRATAPGGLMQAAPPGADAEGEVGEFIPPAPLSSNEVFRRLRQRFGRHPDISPRGPCQWCGGPTYGRPGEGGWCPRCDGEGL